VKKRVEVPGRSGLPTWRCSFEEAGGVIGDRPEVGDVEQTDEEQSGRCGDGEAAGSRLVGSADADRDDRFTERDDDDEGVALGESGGSDPEIAPAGVEGSSNF
jgi:hypothetical protein